MKDKQQQKGTDRKKPKTIHQRKIDKSRFHVCHGYRVTRSRMTKTFPECGRVVRF